ncbi:MAG: hypothetical protein KF817_16005 [Phycisphaeraceae bacterium]|nr:hypothetical protein [Phycisphaeraceae bacterium]
MRFTLIDAVMEQEPSRIVVLKQVSAAEEYLGDHFPGFPILPGVLMFETLVQAARLLCESACRAAAPDRPAPRLVAGDVRALRYGAMIRPGDALIAEVTVGPGEEDGTWTCRGTAAARRADGTTGETACAGRFTMRPLRPQSLAGSRLERLHGDS